MCKQCEANPVYEFTNQRKLCAACFLRWFRKKVLYTIRKFGMVKNGDRIGFRKARDFKSVVLEDVLEMLSENRDITLIEKNSKGANKIAVADTTDVIAGEIVGDIIHGISSSRPPTQKQGKSIIIRPLYLFLDKEVLLYAKLRGLKFERPGKLPAHSRSQIDIKNNKETRGSSGQTIFGKDRLIDFINKLEKKHPEVKQAVVKGMLRVNGVE